MEILISVVILVLIVLMFYGLIFNLNNSEKILQKHLNDFKNRDTIFYLIFRDLFLSTKFHRETSYNKKYDIINITTFNSIHNIIRPNVIYFINQNRELIRLESSKKFKLPIKDIDLYSVYADKIASQVENFNILTTQNSSNSRKKEIIKISLPGAKETNKDNKNKFQKANNFLVFLETKSGNKLLFEVRK